MTTIDERVVGMRFDNAQFQRKSRETLQTLADLKRGTDFSGAHRGLADLQAVGNGFHLNGMAGAVDTVSSRFTALQVAGVTAFATLTSMATQAGLQIARDLALKQPLEGLREYETQINAIQTIMANTASKGTTMEQINAGLDELNQYADKTIYNFGEMARNIGTFTAAGVGLDDSIASIKGFSNVAAMAGANSTETAGAMYQLSQAMSAGTVRLMDWMSIERAGIATEAFRESLMETARVNGIAIDDMIEEHGSLRNTLSEDWLSADIMLQTLSKFTGDLSDEQLRTMGYTEQQIAEIQELATLANDSATKVKTFTQLMGTLAEATGSGWAQSWRIILGDFEEARALFTEISDILGGMIGESAEARNSQLQIWSDLGGREAIIQALRNAFEALMAIVEPIGDAFKEVFPPRLGVTLFYISDALKDFTESLIITEDQSATLKDVFVALFEGLKFGLDLAGDGLRFLFSLLGSGFDVLGALAGVLAPVVEWVLGLGEGATVSGDGLSDFTDELIRIKDVIFGGLITALEWITEIFRNLIQGDYSAIGDMFVDALNPIAGIGDRIRTVWGGVLAWFENTFAAAGLNISNSWSALLDTIGVIGDIIKDISAAFGQFFSGFGEGAEGFFDAIDPTAVLAALNAGVLGGIIIAIIRGFREVTGTIASARDIVNGLSEALDGLKDVFGAMENDIKANTFLKIAIALGILASALWVLAQIEPDRLLGAMSALGVAFGILIASLQALEKMTNDKEAAKIMAITAALILFSLAMRILAEAMVVLGGLSWEELAKGIVGVSVALLLLLVAAEVLDGKSGEMIKVAAALILFSLALYALAGVVAIFGTIPMEVLQQGFIALGILMAFVVGSAVVLSKLAQQMATSAFGLLLMAGALAVLTGVIITMGLIPFEVLQQGMAVTAIMLLGLVAAAMILSAAAPRMLASAVGLMAMAFALNLMVAPIIALGMIPMEVLQQGLIGIAAALLILVVAASLMQNAIVGAGALIVISAAMVILAFGISMLAAIPIEGVGVALLALAGAFLILGAAGLLLTPVLIPLAILAGVMLGLSLSMMVMALAVAVLAPALVLLTGSLLIFAEVSQQILDAVPAMLGIGAGLLVFGIGAAVAGAGVVILGLGLVLLGAGLALVATFGLLGAFALREVVKVITDMVLQVPALLAMGAAFLVVGAGLVVLGAGLVLLGAGSILFGVGLTLIAGASMVFVPAMELLTTMMANRMPIIANSFASGMAALEAGLPIMTQVISSSQQMLFIFMGLSASLITLQIVSQQFGATLQGIADAGNNMVVPISLFADTIESRIPGAIAVLTSGVEEAASVMEGSAPRFTTATTAMIVGVRQTIESNVPDIIRSIELMVRSMVRVFTAGLPQFGPLGARYILQFTMGIVKSLPLVDRSAELAIRLFTLGIQSRIRMSSEMGRTMALEFVRSVTRGVDAGRPAITASAQSVGYAISAGMAIGLRSGSGYVVAAANRVALAALNSARDTLGVASPSKEGVKIGFAVPQGMAIGTDKGTPLVVRSVEDMGASALSAMYVVMRALNDATSLEVDLDPTIRPVLDLSAIRRDAGEIGKLMSAQDVSFERARVMADAIAFERMPKDDPVLDKTQPIQVTKHVEFKQYNTSPEALPETDIYRRTHNQLAMLREELDTNADLYEGSDV